MEPSRPSNVPEGARYSPIEGWFEVGDRKNDERFGPYRMFRKDDGSLLLEARFDQYGRLQGTFKRYHRDGSIAREGAYNEGEAVGAWTYHRGPDDFFPVADPRVTEAVVRLQDRSRTWLYLDAKGREVVPGQPIDERAGSGDSIFEGLAPEEVVKKGALASVMASLAEPTSAKPVDDGFYLPARLVRYEPFTEAGYRDLYGETPPENVVAYAATIAKTCPSMGGVVPLRDSLIANKNRPFEAMMLEHQESPGRGVALRELWAGLVPLATGPGGERYGYAVFETRYEQPTNAVYVFDPSDNEFNLVARTLEDFAYLLSVTGAAASGTLSRKTLDRAYEKLRGRISPLGVFSKLHERLGPEDDQRDVEGSEDGDQRVGFSIRRSFPAPAFLFHRSRWVQRMLLGQAEGAYAAFKPKLDGGLNDERLANIRSTVTSEGMLGTYWLLRTYFLAQDAQLAKLLEWSEDSRSLLVREVATLVRELVAGKRRSLGLIEDIVSVREALLALDPLAKKEEDEDDNESEDEDEDEDEEDEDEE